MPPLAGNGTEIADPESRRAQLAVYDVSVVEPEVELLAGGTQ